MSTPKSKPGKKRRPAQRPGRDPQPAPEGRKGRRSGIDDADPLRQHEYHDRDGQTSGPPPGRPFADVCGHL